ncbi:unnamed protein product [Malus baccata var. baccata]
MLDSFPSLISTPLTSMPKFPRGQVLRGFGQMLVPLVVVGKTFVAMVVAVNAFYAWRIEIMYG